MISSEILELLGLEVIVRSPIKDGFRLKVSFKELGMYIDGFTARPSNREKSDWWVQSPAKKIGKKYVNIPEFDKHTVLWMLIEELCIKAILIYQAGSEGLISDEDLSPESIEASLDRNIKTFGIGKEDI